MNLTNVLQLAVDCPQLVQLAPCSGPGDVTEKLAPWLPALQPGGKD